MWCDNSSRYSCIADGTTGYTCLRLLCTPKRQLCKYDKCSVSFARALEFEWSFMLFGMLKSVLELTKKRRGAFRRIEYDRVITHWWTVFDKCSVILKRGTRMNWFDILRLYKAVRILDFIRRHTVDTFRFSSSKPTKNSSILTLNFIQNYFIQLNQQYLQ